MEHFFCRYLCLLGALFTIISGEKWFKIQRDTVTCIKCGLCEKTCSMSVSILKKGIVSSENYIDCMQCLTICPKECLSANPAPAVAGTAAAIVTCGLIQIGNLTVPDAITTSAAYCFDENEKEFFQKAV